MPVIANVLGNLVSDPIMQQGKNSGTDYVTVSIATTQRGANGEKETIYFECYFNSFLAQRLVNAGVKQGTGLYVYGDLELHPYIHQKGKNTGQPNAGAKVVVKDWQFPPSNNRQADRTEPSVPTQGNGVQTNNAGPTPNPQNPQGQAPTYSGAPNGYNSNNYGTVGANQNMYPNTQAGSLPPSQGGAQNIPVYNQNANTATNYMNNGSNVGGNTAPPLPFA